MRLCKLDEIKISEGFAKSTPSEEKMEECRRNWNNFHRQDRYLVVNNAGYLIDGYIQYLVLKEKGINEAQVKISDRRKKCWYRKNIEGWTRPKYRNQLTTYVYGMHFNKKTCTFSKEYVWRVPDSWNNWEEGLLPGDEVYVHTNYGKKKIVITKIAYLDKCPVEFPVKKVCKRKNI